MNPAPTPAGVQAFVLDTLEEELAGAGVDAAEVDSDFDLLAAGVVDSLGLMNLFLALEEEYGVRLDFEGLDPEQLTVLGMFSAYVANQASLSSSP